MERVQLRALPLRVSSAHGAALPARSRTAFVAHLYLRRQTQSQAAQARPYDRSERDRRPCRLQPTPHHPLRSGWDLRERARQPRRRRSRRRLRDRPRHVRGQGPLGDRPRPSEACLRLLVASDLIYVSALGNPDGDAPGGVFVIDHDTFAVKGRWEIDRGPQKLAYDFWWHLGYDTAITSEWGTPNMVEGGVNPEILLAGEYGHKIHIWDLPKRRHRQEIDLGKEYQMPLELRPAHDPSKAYGFVGVVTSLKDLSASIWTWHLDGSTYKIEKVIDIPAEPADPDDLPPLLKGFKAVPPLVTDINLSLDDRWLYVSAWGTGEFLQFDVSDPFKPKKTGSVHLGGIVRKAAHPTSGPLNGGPQMVELSRDGKRAYLTNSLYASWDEQFYPEGITSWATLIDAKPEGGLGLDKGFFTTFEQRTHQVHLEGGDASSDSYCYS